MSLPPAILAELVAATRQAARGLVDEQDPYLLAAVVCVAHRCVHPDTYGWGRQERAYPLATALDAAREAERLDMEAGFRLADWLGEDEVAA